MHGGLVDVDYLVEWPLNQQCAQLLHKLQLFLSQLLVLSYALPEAVVRPLVLDTMLEIVGAQRLYQHLIKPKLLFDH